VTDASTDVRTEVLAIDLGGTRLRVARVAPDGTIRARLGADTPTAAGPEAVVAEMLSLLERLTSESAHPDPGRPGFAGIGLAAPGPLDPATGVVYEVPNMPGWRGFPLATRLAAETGLPVWVHNDANLAGLAEARLGAGRDCDPLVYLTVSTGVGGGIVAGGEVFAGRHGLAGELGHTIVRAGGPACNLGHPGCLEAAASGTAIARRAREALAAGEPSTILDHVGEGGTVTAEVVARAARAGDRLARAVFDEAAWLLGLAIGGFINVFDPARVVIGGGVSQAWDLLEASMWSGVRAVAMAWDLRPIEIVPAALGDDAGLVGAGLYALGRGGSGGA